MNIEFLNMVPTYMKPLTDDAVRVKLQRKEVDHMKKIIGQHQQQVEKIDLSLICDG